MKKISCGFIIRDINTGKYLGCHPYGRKDNLCDIPKGGINDNETYFETAIRELLEETGIQQNELINIKEIGLVEYNKEKDLYIYTADANINLKNLKCVSTFEWFGEIVPEMIGYELGESDIFFKNLKKVIDKCNITSTTND